MAMKHLAKIGKTLALVASIGAVGALAACDTNHYEQPAASQTTTTVTPAPTTSSTTTERTTITR